MIDSHSCSKTCVMVTAHQCISWQWDMQPMLIRHKNSGVFSKAFTNTAGSTTLTMLKMGALSTTNKLLRMMHDCSHPVNIQWICLMMPAHQSTSWQWDTWLVLIMMMMVMYARRFALVHQVPLLWLDVPVKAFKHTQPLHSLTTMGQSCPSLECRSADLCKLVTMQQYFERVRGTLDVCLGNLHNLLQLSWLTLAKNSFSDQTRTSVWISWKDLPAGLAHWLLALASCWGWLNPLNLKGML